MVQWQRKASAEPKHYRVCPYAGPEEEQLANSVELRALKRSERRGLESKVNNRMLRARVHRRVVAEVARSRPVIDVADRVGRRLRTAC